MLTDISYVLYNFGSPKYVYTSYTCFIRLVSILFSLLFDNMMVLDITYSFGTFLNGNPFICTNANTFKIIHLLDT